MSAAATEFVDASTLDEDELIATAYRMGNLSWMLHEHQLAVYEKYRAFEARVIDGDNDGPPIFVLDCARRWGKTYLIIVIKGEDAQRRPRSIHTLATAFLADIGEIVIPMFEDIYERAPDDCKPVLRTSHKGQNLGFYYPNGSSVKLVGVDKKPKGLRGRKSDGHAWTEAAFFDELERPVSKTLHQFQRVPHACLLLESSAPEDPEHDFDEIFVPDAKRRDAYVFQTLDDNQQLTADQKRKYYEDACKVSVESADRELYGVRSRNLSGIVIPEFDESRHVRDVEIPKHAACITSDDPGLKHLNGLVHALYDFDNARIIVQKSWAGLNAGPAQLAAVVAADEYALWGTWPHPRMKHIPLESTEDAQGWIDLLRYHEYAHLAETLHDLAQRPRNERPTYENTPGKFIRQDIPDHFTWWNGIEHKPNPAARVSDVDLQLIRALDEHYGLEFEPTSKAELHTMVNLLRSWVSAGRVVFLPGAGPVIEHVRKGKWDKQRSKFAETRGIGHADGLAAMVYLCRYVDLNLQNIRPHPPADTLLIVQPGVNAQERLPWRQKLPHEIEMDRRLAQMQQARGREPGRIRGWND